MSGDEDFISNVGYFFLERGDPTRFSGWDPERCKRLLPEFYEAWEKSTVYENLATLAIKDALRKID